MNRPAYSLGFCSLDIETNFDELPLQGTIPPWLTGTLLRVGPAKFEVGKRAYNHWFDGLAMLHKFAFSHGRVSYANRYLQSQAYREATETEKITRGEFATDPCRTLFQRITAFFSPKFTDNCNVNIAQLAGQVVALTETRLPIRFDPNTLETLGGFVYDGGIKGPLAIAHPHYDRNRGCHYSFMLDFGKKSRYQFFRIDQATGKQTVIATIPVDRPAYMHSFGMTERYLVLAEFPLVVNPLRFLFSGKPFIRNYAWEPERGVRFHIVDKETGQLVREARSQAFFAFHHVNAFEVGDLVIVDIVAYPNASVIDQFYLDHLRSVAPVMARANLTRFRIGPGESLAHEMLSESSLELPSFNYRRLAGLPYRYVFGVGNEVPGDFIDSLVKLDLDERTMKSWHEEGCYPGEPVFVEAEGATNEDEGVILSIVLDVRRAASFLLVLDAATFHELARAEVSHHIPFGFHGIYLSS